MSHYNVIVSHYNVMIFWSLDMVWNFFHLFYHQAKENAASEHLVK